MNTPIPVHVDPGLLQEVMTKLRGQEKTRPGRTLGGRVQREHRVCRPARPGLLLAPELGHDFLK
jgi:hypothetical protein